MTTESKLALIIGFVLILVVGVLVSDHLSQGTTDEIEPNPINNRQLTVNELPHTGNDARTNTPAIDHLAPAHAATNQGNRGELNAAPDDAPVVISQAAPSKPSLLDQFRGTVNTLGTTDVPALAAETNRDLPDAPARSYTVRTNDSLYAIARETLGDSERWRELHRMNMNLLGPDPVLQPGMVLTLPGSAIVTQPQRARRDSRPFENVSKQTTYTVQSGDVLSMISQRLLGTSRRVDEIVKLNGLSDADEIRVGMVLKIPAR